MKSAQPLLLLSSVLLIYACASDHRKGTSFAFMSLNTLPASHSASLRGSLIIKENVHAPVFGTGTSSSFIPPGLAAYLHVTSLADDHSWGRRTRDYVELLGIKTKMLIFFPAPESA